MILRFLAKIGAVGGTARWAANGYTALKKQRPQSSNQEIFNQLILLRYRVFPNDRIRDQLLSEIDRFSTLRHLVVAILSEEAGFLDNTIENQIMFQDVITEALLKKGIPKELT